MPVTIIIGVCSIAQKITIHHDSVHHECNILALGVTKVLKLKLANDIC